jgi:hypothetical protein
MRRRPVGPLGRDGLDVAQIDDTRLTREARELRRGRE